MPTWRCPYCGTPQAETARCWVCHRSTTSCFTCRYFCRGVAAQLGFCGKDRKRAPLSGSEQRACWERIGDSASAPRSDDTETDRVAADVPPGFGLWAAD